MQYIGAKVYVCVREKEHVYDCVSAFVHSGEEGGGVEFVWV